MRTKLIAAACAGSFLILADGCADRAANKPSPVQATSTVPAADQGQPAPAPKQEEHSLIDRVKTASAAAPAEFEGEGWRPLFNGTDMSGWVEGNFGGGGKLEVAPGVFVMNMGEPFTGIRYTNDFPTANYEIALDAMRLMGSDFFSALTVPVSNSFCSLVVGGWGGSLVGISSLNGLDASENETTKFITFENNHWYRIRMRVTPGRLEAWIDKDKVVDVVISSKLVTLRPGEIEECKPLGLATWQTAAAFREIRFRRVDGPADPPPKSIY